MDYMDFMSKLDDLNAEDQAVEKPAVVSRGTDKDRTPGRQSSHLNFKRNLYKSNFEMHAEICSLGQQNNAHGLRRGEVHDLNP